MRTLRINGVDISTYGATLLTVDYGYAKVVTYKDWLRGSMNPLFYEQNVRYTTASLKMLVEAASRAELDKNCSNLVALAKKGKYQVTDCEWFIDGDLVEAEDEPINSKAREVTLRIEGIKSQSVSQWFYPEDYVQFTTFTPIGNCEVPVKFTFIPDMAHVNFIARINGKDYSVINVPKEGELTIDGINGKVLQGVGNKIEDYQAWDFPTLIGGQENSIRIPSGHFRIEYDGRWM